jgi:dipeptidyl aminopeptidase/acylaminoacyl peptidase
MRRLRAFTSLLTFATFAGCGGATPPEVPVPAPEQATPPAAAASLAPVVTPRYDAKTFYETTSVRGGTFSPDESSILVSTDATGIYNAVQIPLGGGTPIPLTESTKESIWAVSYFPQDGRFLYSSDQGGNEKNHLFVRELDGTVKDLTPGENLKANFLGWTGDRSGFWVMTNERNDKFFDLYRYSAGDYSRKLVFENNDSWLPGAISNDERWIALAKVKNNADSDVYLWDATHPKAAPSLITAHDGMVQHDAATFTPDSKQLIYTTDAGGEFYTAKSYDLETKAHGEFFQTDWDVQGVAFSRTGKYRVIWTNEDARTVVRTTDTQTGKPVMIRDLPPGDIAVAGFSESETKLAFYLTQDRASKDLYVLDLSTGTHERLTSTMSPRIDSAQLVDGKVIRYPSFDGLEIPAILYKPKDASDSHPVPAVVWVHGGPGGQSRLGYKPMIQHLVNHGYAVLAVNNRGSSGYGKSFYHMDDRKHGDVDLKDCMWGRRYLESLPWVDGAKVGILGGSYGGYMVAAALAFEPDAFEVGIDIFGVTNWVRTLESIPPWWAAYAEALYAELGNPNTDAERLRKISPLFHAEKITKPLLVVQGANDPRVLKAESDEIVAAVKKNGVPVEYVVFDDEGHGFRKKANRIVASEAFLLFLDEHLAIKPAGSK